MDLVDSGYIPQILFDIHVEVEWIILGQVSDQGFNSLVFFRNRDIVDPDLSGVRRQIPGNHAHRGGLTGSIWAEKSQDFPFPDLEGYIIDSLLEAKLLGKVRNENGQCPGVLSVK